MLLSANNHFMPVAIGSNLSTRCITLVAYGSISTSHIDLLPYGSKGNIIATTA